MPCVEWVALYAADYEPAVCVLCRAAMGKGGQGQLSFKYAGYPRALHDIKDDHDYSGWLLLPKVLESLVGECFCELGAFLCLV